MKKTIIIIIILFQAIVCFSQRNSYFFFYLVNSGRKPVSRHLTIKDDLTITTPLQSVVNFNNDTIWGKLTIKKGELHVETSNESHTFRFEDSAINSIRFFHDGVELFLRKINVSGEQKLRRVLLDTLGLAVYDDVFSFSKSVYEIDYDELILEYNQILYNVTDFWTTSRKRKMVDILNQIFKSDLGYKEYRTKELLMESILDLSNRVLGNTFR